MEPAPFDDVKAVLGNLGGGSEARIALLERRSMIPPSPEDSGGLSAHAKALPNGNSMHSIGSGLHPNIASYRASTPQPSLGQSTLSQDPLDDANNNPTAKKRRLKDLENDGGAPSREQRATTPSAGIRPSLSPYLHGPDPAKPQGSTPGSKGKQKNTISRYFPQLGGTGEQARSSATDGQEHDGRGNEREAKAALDAECKTLRETNLRLQVELKQAHESAVGLEADIQRLQQENSESKLQHGARDTKARELVVSLATDNARHERALTLVRLQQAAPRLGTLGFKRRGIDVQETWEDGSAFKEIQQRLLGVSEQRETIESARKAAKRRLPLPGQPVPAQSAAFNGGDLTNTAVPIHPDDWVLQEEIFRTRLNSLKREEDGLRGDLARLEVEKTAHLRELKRMRDEEGSRFSDFPVLHRRYLLLNLLGRGGFSEVFRALDVRDLRPVAVKIHQLSSQWSEAKKASYVKHSVREYHIHRQLHHPRVVRLVDIFEIDNNTFATVLELCTGGDLDGYMKMHETLPEREARAIVAQILSALTYLNTKPRSIIHYDLKPANILFDANGECKITDFGLSKVVEEGHTQGMELTSQGAGTYWYLPPECFDVKSTPMISNKVDVWSVGVILYQMLYGRRPFGHDQSQEQILRNEVMLNAREVAFPNKPSVSVECRDFMKRCLAYRPDDRMDVHAAASHSFLSMKKEKRISGGAKDAAQQQ